MSDMLNKLPLEAQDKIRDAQAELPNKGVKIAELARAFGLEVYRGELPPNHSGVIVKNAEKGGGAGYYIMTEKSDPLNRRRFTIAHELAHFLLHRDKIGDNYPENALFRGTLSNREEIEANKLAADILMPHEKIDALIKEVGHKKVTLQDIAECFEVSRSAVRVRLGIPGRS